MEKINKKTILYTIGVVALLVIAYYFRAFHITICSPIWVFALAAPVRDFCKKAAGQIKEVDYILVHHTGGRYENAAREMDDILKIRHTSLKSIRCRNGVFKEIRGGIDIA